MSGQCSQSRTRVQLGKVLARFCPQDGFRQPEIQDLHGAFRRDLYVGWLDVAVDDALGVSRFQRFGDLPGIVERFANRERTAENLAFYKLHDQVVEVEPLSRVSIR